MKTKDSNGLDKVQELSNESNPPFGGKEGKEAQTFFDYPTSATQVLFIQHVLKSMNEAKPYREKAAEFSAQPKALETDLREKKKTKTQRPEQLEKLEADWKTVVKQARENQAKAQEIEDAVYDLKAVNPNRVSTEDTRTPAELLDFITEKGKEADSALHCLRQLVTIGARRSSSTSSAPCRNNEDMSARTLTHPPASRQPPPPA